MQEYEKNINPKTILIIEDEEPIIHALSKVLGPLGHHLMEAPNGLTGLKAALETHPNLIILDLVLPKMDGIKVLEELRKDAWGKTAQVLVLTNLSGDKYEESAKKHNVLAYLVKINTSINDLAEKVRYYIELGRQEQQINV